MAANLFNRYIWLVDNIYRAGSRGIMLDEINRRWERSQYNDDRSAYPERTFHRHKNAIKEMFDIDIVCDKRTKAYMIENADDIERGGVRSWLLNTFAVNNLINESHHLKRRILFEEIPSGQRFLTPIIEAMRDGVTLMLTYRSFNMENPVTFEVQPYCVKVFRQRWYLVAYNLYYRAIRIYALDRIGELLATETEFRLPKDFDAHGYFADAFGIIVDEECDVERVRVRIGGMQRDYVRTLPLHASQTEHEITEESSVFEYRLRPTVDFRQELLTHAVNAEGEIEVLEPLWLREQMKQIGADLQDTHNDLTPLNP